jgi:crystallin alpha B
MSYTRSLLPLLLQRERDSFWDRRPDPLLDDRLSSSSRLLDQHFGLSLSDALDESLAWPTRTLARQFSRTAPTSLLRPRTGFSEVTNDQSVFSVKLDVAHFEPHEITVKSLEGGTIIIEGRHEEKPDEHGYISRQFSRKYLLPADVEVDKISSSLTTDGVLTVTAPKRQPKAITDASGATVIPITKVAADEPIPRVTSPP